MKVLVVEDSDRLRKALGEGLGRSGFVVDLAADGRSALGYVNAAEYDVVVLDIMMPGLDGLGVLEELRDRGNPVKVLILSAKDQIDDRVRGLQTGADDYLVKPFAFEELVARIRTLARRGSTANGPVINLGELSVDMARRLLTADGIEVPVTPSEYNLVEYLSLRRGRVVSKTQLRDMLCNADSESVSNTVEVLVSNVRKKLADAGAREIIHTKRGFGYYVD